jgi:tetratricopeptide (TPR) repeat protein
LSLLLDALKRAEQEKLARQGEAGAARPTREAAPPPAGRIPASAPAASLELQPLTHAMAGAAAGVTLGVPPRADPHTAQAVFQAKAANAGEGPKGRGMLFATLAAVGVVAIAAAAYVWYSVTALAPKNAAHVARPRPIASAPIASPAGAPPASEVALAGSVPGMAAFNPDNVTPATQAPPAPVPAPVTPRAHPAEDAAANLLRDASPVATTEPLRLERTPEAPRRVPAEIAAGYDQLRQGNLPAARRSYDAALAGNPANLDALLGLATVEARAGSRTAAVIAYRRALDVDPRNATALAGLAALADSARPDAVEAQLRGDLARSPDSGALHFTLGNALAAQSRWHEAQSEYFEAHRLDPGSPEILYNLAVSIDRLGQPRVAAGFYTRALDAVRGQPNPPFDTAAVRRRLEELR